MPILFYAFTLALILYAVFAPWQAVCWWLVAGVGPRQVYEIGTYSAE